MRRLKSNITQFGLILIVSIITLGCEQKKENNELTIDITILEKEIESRLREYERHLKNGDSIALGNMYMKNAEIIPSTVGRENITKAFGSYIRDSITGSSFKTTQKLPQNSRSCLYVISLVILRMSDEKVMCAQNLWGEMVRLY